MNINWSKAPEGATHHHAQTAATSEHWRKDGFFCNVGFESDGWQLEPFPLPLTRYTARPAAPEWTGEGLPPVGTVCELSHPQKFTQGTVLEEFPAGTKMLVGGHANFGGADVAVVIVSGRHFTGTTIPSLLRPIRTPEQIEAEERKRVIEEMVYGAAGCERDGQNTNAFLICGFLYDAGYRKQEA